ncbi:MAG: hypothetical protein JXQ27_10575 [Acidobacteria bacterium]|nr:hypothetical protein [Acidobacteriota bacterium]
MGSGIRLLWNIVMGLFIVKEAVTFDYHHFKRLGRKFWRPGPEKWAFSLPERRAFHRCFLWIIVMIIGNALISLARLLREALA